MLQKAIPVLPALNLRATIDFYENRLGCRGVNLGHYAIIQSGDAELHFYLVTDPLKFVPVTCLLCSDNIEDLYSLFAGKDMLQPQGKISDMLYGKREFSIKDNNGNTIRFTKAALK